MFRISGRSSGITLNYGLRSTTLRLCPAPGRTRRQFVGARSFDEISAGTSWKDLIHAWAWPTTCLAMPEAVKVSLGRYKTTSLRPTPSVRTPDHDIGEQCHTHLDRQHRDYIRTAT